MTITQGKFAPLEVNNGKLTKFVTENGGLFQVEVKSLTPEDGSGSKYLINYEKGSVYNPSRSDGYVDLVTMKGFLQD